MPELSDYAITPVEQEVLLAHRCVYLIGDVDSGKSTLAMLIAKMFASHGPTAMVDLDSGQATIGAPTTFAWAIAGRNGLGRRRGMFFLGSTSPAGRFADAVDGAAALVKDANAAVEKIVVDTCGLASGQFGNELHVRMIDAVKPDALVFLQRKNELAELIEKYRRTKHIAVVRARVPAGVIKRSAAVRRTYRAGKLREYLKGSKEMTLDLSKMGLDPDGLPLIMKGRVVSLRDKAGRDAAIGIVTKYSPRTRAATILTPYTHTAGIHTVALGTMRFARDGRQLGFNV